MDCDREKVRAIRWKASEEQGCEMREDGREKKEKNYEETDGFLLALTCDKLPKNKGCQNIFKKLINLTFKIH